MTTLGSLELVDGLKFQLLHFKLKRVNNRIQLQNLIFAVLSRLKCTITISFIWWTFFWSQHCLTQSCVMVAMLWHETGQNSSNTKEDQFPKRHLLSAQHRGKCKWVSQGHEELGTTIGLEGFDININDNPAYKTKDSMATLTVPSEIITCFTCPQMDCNLRKHPFNGRGYCCHVRSVIAFQGKAQGDRF